MTYAMSDFEYSTPVLDHVTSIKINTDGDLIVSNRFDDLDPDSIEIKRISNPLGLDPNPLAAAYLLGAVPFDDLPMMLTEGVNWEARILRHLERIAKER